MLYRGLLLAAALLVLGTVGCSAYQPTDPEFRAYWVDAWHPGFKTPAQVDSLLSNVRACNFNTVVVQMRRRGDTYYPSPYEPFASDANPSFDALAYLIQKAHNLSPRIEVYYWLTTVPIASDTLPSDPNHPIYRYPEYLTKDDSGNDIISENYWFDPGHPGAEQYIYSVVMDVVNRYDVDGISFDYIRFGSQRSGYNETSVARFNSFYGRTGRPYYADALWSDWRRAQITNLVRKVYANAIAMKPNIKISASTITWSPPASSDANWTGARAYYQVFQDWKSWIQEGILDLNVPMDYYDCEGQDQYWQDFYTWLCFAFQHQYNRRSAIGLTACNDPVQCLIDHVNATRNASCSGGYTSYGYAAYAYDCADRATLCSLNPVRVSVPNMPWKTSPTKGHIKGTVTLGSISWIDGATVSITGPISRTMPTDGTGFYAFIDLPPGNYTVTASKSGIATTQVPAAVTVGQVTTANIQVPSPPITINNVASGNEQTGAITITWNTNIMSSSQVAYGLDETCSNLSMEDLNYTTAHSVTLSGLLPLTPYYFRVISRNPDGLMAESAVYACVTGADIPDIIIDDPQASYTGAWVYATGSTDKYGDGYRYCSTAATADHYATFRPNLPKAGSYRVSVWYPQGSNRSTAAPFTIYYSGGSQLYTVNQQINGGKWNVLATKPFVVGTAGNVSLSNGAALGALVMADAVRFEYQPETTAPTTPTGLQVTPLSHDRVFLSWNASTDNVGVAGYRIYRGGALVGASTTTSFADTGLAGNTWYNYQVSAYDTSGNKSGQCTAVNVCTYSVPPSYGNVTCNKAAGVWHSSNPFTFTAVGGFGPGTASYYYYVWDNQPTHTWDGSEWAWAAGLLNVPVTPSAEPYYLHLIGYNALGIAHGSADLGPYYYDSTAPPAPVVTDDGDSTPIATSIHAVWTGDDPESGSCGYQYAVGTTPGATDVVGWASSDNTEETVTIPEQAPGTVLYVSVKSLNCAGLWSNVGISDGITIGSAVATVAAARALADGSAVLLSDKKVSAAFADCFFIEDDDRTAGIRVNLPGVSFALAQRVNVSGVLETISGERRIGNAVATPAP